MKKFLVPALLLCLVGIAVAFAATSAPATGSGPCVLQRMHGALFGSPGHDGASKECTGGAAACPSGEAVDRCEEKCEQPEMSQCCKKKHCEQGEVQQPAEKP